MIASVDACTFRVAGAHAVRTNSNLARRIKKRRLEECAEARDVPTVFVASSAGAWGTPLA